MNLKTYIACAIVLFPPVSWAQGLTAVMADSNGVIQRPANLVFGSASQNIYQSAMANLLTQADAGTFAAATNSFVSCGINATNTAGKAAVRLIGRVNNLGMIGVGTRFGENSHAVYTIISTTPKNNGKVRVVLGNNDLSDTNIAEVPVNRAIGYELEAIGNSDTNRVRLIAHNGTTLTNGAWVNMDTAYARFTIGVRKTKASGTVELLIGKNSKQATVISNATISGGPTENAGQALSAFDVGIFTTGTNSANLGLDVYSAWVEVSD